MINERNLVLNRVMVGFDAVIISLVFFATFILRQYFPLIYKLNLVPSVHVFREPSLSVSDYLVVYFMIVPIWCVALSFCGMYGSPNFKSFWKAAWMILKSAFWTVLIFGVLVFLFKMKFVSRLFFAIFVVMAMAALMAEKFAILAFVRRNLEGGFNNRRLLIFGSGKRAAHIVDEIAAHPDWGYEVVKIVDYAACMPECKYKKECEVVTGGEDMRRILHELQVDEVIFVVPRKKLDVVEPYLFVCDEEGVDSAISGDLFSIRSTHFRHTDIDGVPLLTLERNFDIEWQLFIKRAIDIMVSGVGILVVFPLFVLTAILIKLTSPGRIFFTQKRVGLHGRIFTMYKFRSMHEGAEKELKKLMYLNEVEGPIFKIKDDPRITRAGRFLRRFSIDELPQLFNVFIGRMSLVGPRPALPGEVEQYASWQRRRLSVRPGITCLWQVYHRGEGDFKKWMQSDLEYVDHWSLLLDSKILMKTLMAVVFGRGAY